MSDNLPAEAASGGEVATAEQWAELDTFDDGLAAFVGEFGLAMPRLRSDFGRNGKGWIDDLTGDAQNELNIIILACPPSRAYWELSIDEGGGGTPDCASRVNFTVGRPDDGVPNPQAVTCAECPHSQWGDNNERPACGVSANVLAYDVDGDRMFWLRFAGTGLKPFKNYLSALQARRKPMYAVVTTITLADEKRDKLEWLKPVFGIGRELTPLEVRPLRDVAEKAMAGWHNEAEAMDATTGGDRPEIVDTDTVAAKFAATYADGEEPF